MAAVQARLLRHTGTLLCVLITYAIFATCWRFLGYVVSQHAAIVAAVVTAVLAAAIVGWNESLASLARRLHARVEPIGERTWLLGCIALGLALRGASLAHCLPEQTSDFSAYLQLAQRLVSDGIYAIGGTRAYWPPGLPFALAPWVAVLGSHWLVPILNNATMFVLLLMLVRRLAGRVTTPSGARLAMLAVAVWPNLVLASGLADKQQLIALCMCGSLLLYLHGRARDDQPRQAATVGAGALLGAAVLTQPSHILFVGVFFVFEALAGATLRNAIARTLMVTLGLVLVVAPWTARNYAVLGHVVPVTNTSGMSLYVGNNPDATGVYVPVAGLEGLDEVAANKEAGRLAKAWIKEHPVAFLGLVIPKNVAYLGDDSDGAYWSIKRGCGSDGRDYQLAKTASYGFWLLVLLATLGAAVQMRGSRPDTLDATAPAALLLLLWFGYFFAIHSVFESGGRHHIAPAIGLVMIASRLGARRSSPGTDPAAGQPA